MSKTILQVPLNEQLRNEAEKAALSQGFSSLQEAVRLFLANLATKRISATFKNEDEIVHLSTKAINRYEKIDKDFQNGKNIYEAKNIDDLIAKLHENSIS